MVARYTATGTLDTEFNDTGLATGEIQGRAYAVALQSDGKIIVAGTSTLRQKYTQSLIEIDGGEVIS